MYTKLKYNLIGALLCSTILVGSCSKDKEETASENRPDREASTRALAGKNSSLVIASYVTHTIAAGVHNSDKSVLRSVKTSEMKFAVKFDSSAIYQTVNSTNQYDINKLYGFSEGFNNQYNSARIGWNWYDNALHLHAYVYKKGVRLNQKITSVEIGPEIICSIKVSGTSYIFTVNGITVTMGRGLSTSTASGLQQYPYFGGDEVAPHKITIQIKNL